MTFSSVSAVDGQSYPAELQRIANSALAPGSSGVFGSSDLLVRGLGAAGVSVDPGGVIASSRYTDATTREAYVAVNDSASGDAIIAVPASGSGGSRTDYVIWRAYDTQYAGETDPTGKGNGLVLVSSLPTSYPYAPLAKIVQPASNSAGIQQSMVTDLRKIANPKWELSPHSVPTVSSETGLVLNSQDSGGEYFPNGNGPQSIDIPDWATYATIDCWWIGIYYASGLNPWGSYWVEWGPSTGGSNRTYTTQRFSFDSSGPHTSNFRENWYASDDVYIPAAMRGTTQLFVPKAYYQSTDKGVSMTAMSGMVLNVRFREVADPTIS